MKKCFVIMLPKNWRLIRELIMDNSAMRIVAPITTLLLLLMLCSADPIWAKGPLDGDASYFIEHTIVPILVKANLCSSRQDFIEHEYFFFTAWDSIQFRMYGITDEKIIKEIFLAILNSGLKVSHFSVWSSTHKSKWFFEKPILKFTDHTGDK